MKEEQFSHWVVFTWLGYILTNDVQPFTSNTWMKDQTITHHFRVRIICHMYLGLKKSLLWFHWSCHSVNRKEDLSGALNLFWILSCCTHGKAEVPPATPGWNRVLLPPPPTPLMKQATPNLFGWNKVFLAIPLPLEWIMGIKFHVVLCAWRHDYLTIARNVLLGQRNTTGWQRISFLIRVSALLLSVSEQ